MASPDGKSSPPICDQLEPRDLQTIPLENVCTSFTTLDIVGLPTRPGIRQLRLEDLPYDILCLILRQPICTWVSTWDSVAHGPRRRVFMLEDRRNAVSQKDLCNLARTSRGLYHLALPQLYCVIEIQDTSSMLRLWATLCHLRPQNAFYIRHLVFRKAFHTVAVAASVEMWAISQNLFVTDPRTSPEPHIGSLADPVEPPSALFKWADGRPLLSSHFMSRAPNLAQRIFFDIIARSPHLQNLCMTTPSHEDTHAAFLFRQALVALNTPSLPRPTQNLQHLQTITINSEDDCGHCLSKYGILVIPTLERVVLVSREGRFPRSSWYLELRVFSEGISRTTTTILQRAHKLWINHTGPLIDNYLGLKNLPNLQGLSFHPFRDQYCLFSPCLREIDEQLERRGGAVQFLQLTWTFSKLAAPEWSSLSRPIHLTCLSALRSLVTLTVSSQVLFGSLNRLLVLLGRASDDSDSHNLNSDRPIVSVLQALPPTLQHLTLVEYWCESELGPHDETTRERLMTRLGRNDKMEARPADEMITSDADTTTSPRAAIRAPHETAIVDLVLAFCTVWLSAKPTVRELVIEPQRPTWYGLFAHPVVLAEAHGLSCKKYGGGSQLAIRYKFAEEL
ncbi:hypothetical protein N0V93_009855 [Gnomoniopsis smithogilvyi]|uniref:Uncharacterized protein n=1 Tax=Gnomoniopsis smithogilvyi TaxID=1191159 RepID=A0A9W8YHW5_9PEZI|nr:hypothetical protein N0V93_009855 [Gnomoniopsis smithogilvyi]